MAHMYLSDHDGIASRLIVAGSVSIGGILEYMPAVPFPTDAPPLRRGRLGRALRGYRERKGLKVKQVAERLGWNPLKISRQERGETKPWPEDILQLAEVYGLSDRERHGLQDLLATVDTHGWWRTYRADELMGGVYISYEDEATSIRAWHRGVVPALAQTEGYVRGILSHPLSETSPDRRETMVQVRMTRRLILSRDEPPRPTYHAIIEEAALRRPVTSDGQIMADQMSALRDLSDRDNVTIQIVPTRAAVVDVDEAFILLTFAADPTVIVTDGLQHNLISPDPGAVDLYTVAWERITRAALSPDDSRAMLGDLETEYKTQ